MTFDTLAPILIALAIAFAIAASWLALHGSAR
jgi:hypothetical protein